MNESKLPKKAPVPGAVYRVEGPGHEEGGWVFYPATLFGEHVGGDAVAIRYRHSRKEESLGTGFYLCRKSTFLEYGDSGDADWDRRHPIAVDRLELVPIPPLTPTQMGAAWSGRYAVSEVGKTPDGMFVVRTDNNCEYTVVTRPVEWLDDEGNLVSSDEIEEKVAPILDGESQWRETQYWLCKQSALGMSKRPAEWDECTDDPEVAAAWLDATETWDR